MDSCAVLLTLFFDMQKKIILDKKLLAISIDRLCQQLIENHSSFQNTVLIGLQPRGVYLAQRIQERLKVFLSKEVALGKLDITFHRDDFRRRSEPIKANKTEISFLTEGKKVILVDDVLFSGRSVRAAMDAMASFGRPEGVELLVLIDRRYTRELPIQADYVGRQINSMLSQKVFVDWKGIDGAKSDNVWLIDQEGETNE